jgi:hypothetical protein
MAFIRITDTTNFVANAIISVWVITKQNNEKIIVETDNPFKTLFNNGYIDITDIFGRKILLNTQLCVEMVQTSITRVQYKKKTEYYWGTPTIEHGWKYRVAEEEKPITLEQRFNICG